MTFCSHVFSSQSRSACVGNAEGFIAFFMFCSTWGDLSAGLNFFFSLSSFVAWQQLLQAKQYGIQRSGHFFTILSLCKTQELLKCLAAQRVHKLLCYGYTHTHTHTHTHTQIHYILRLTQSKDMLYHKCTNMYGLKAQHTYIKHIYSISCIY